MLDTDIGPPGRAALTTVVDPRVVHYWDANNRLSAAIKPSLAARGNFHGKRHLIDEEIVWDFVGVYPTGMTWESEAPPPAFMAAPVVNHIAPLRAWIQNR